MSTQHFVPEVWAANLLTSLETAHVYGSLANRDYEGQIRTAGDTVRITSVSDPTISDYVPGTTVINPEPLQTSQRALTITESKMFAFEIDDVDARQQMGGIMAEGMSRASYRLRDRADKFNAGKMVAGVQAANILAGKTITVHSTTSTGNPSAASFDAYEGIVQMGVRLSESDVPEEGRVAVIPPWYHSLLLLDERFTDSAQRGASSAVTESSAMTNRNVGRVSGFDLWVSNNVPVVSNAAQIVGGVRSAYTFAEQIVSVEAYRPESSFSDAVKGLHVYGGKVVRPDHLVLLQATRA